MGWESTEQRVLLLTEQHWQEKLLLLSVAGRKRSSSQTGSSADRGNSHYIATLQLLQEPSVQRDGEGAQHSIRCPWSSTVSHTLCPGRAEGRVWELCFHIALWGSLLINLKRKHLIVSCISNSLVLSHQQWQWAALKPNRSQNRES